jgi:16S rRNA (cytosine1402-N4)-methyltransferase
VQHEFSHKPVMLEEAMEALRPHSGGLYLDGTLGGAGHAEAILARSSPGGRLVGFDLDSIAVETAQARLMPFAGRFEIRQANFSEMAQLMAPSSCDGVLLDLGVSSPQLDVAERGFSFQETGPLDMRMDSRQALTAAALVNHSSAEELAKIFWEFGGERESRRIARAIVKDREAKRFETTRDLASLIERLSPRRGRRAHPATRVFQALRIAVNDEIGSLKSGLVAAIGVLKPGGRLVVITFHSLEDRVVKEFARERARDYETGGQADIPELRRPKRPEVRILTRKAVVPGPRETNENPRARSAQMRVMEKL